ncbi:Nucleosome assembly protein 1,1 [Symbiodinium microadriaticum]|uniref:Nucleosome assembly protein 1,1 n=1 Tax=Symbiodinium microadriaticum TaxID=2951 RepID=A0A1Q9D3J4_SYMMI|nr:Nucleosome assembly protein 1,1 [Symbiodinium microadriaticum]
MSCSKQDRVAIIFVCRQGTGQGWPATDIEEKTSQEGRCRPSRLLAASQLKPEQGKLEKPAKPEKASLQGCLASREALLKQRLAFFADAQGRHRALNLASATLQVWKQNVASRRLLAAQSDAAFYKKRLQEKCVGACQQAAARRLAFEAGALAAASRTALRCRCLQAWRSLARARFCDVSAEEYSSLLTAHLEHNERCLRVLEAWAVGLEASLVRVCFKAWSKQLVPERKGIGQPQAQLLRSSGVEVEHVLLESCRVGCGSWSVPSPTLLLAALASGGIAAGVLHPGRMGKKKTEPEQPEAEPKKEAEAAPEDPPIIKELKEIDDKYLAVEREYEKAVQELQKQYSAKQQPFIDQRTQILTNIAAAEGEEAKASGTPALRGFWKEAMKNLPALEEHIEEWDEPVLDYCKDITKAWLDEADISKGFKLIFHFVENPYFTNTELWKEYHVEEASPYTGEVSAKEIKAAEIDWNAGKNVTVEKVAKKVKGGGAKKAKQKGKEKEEPRDSFFRGFFRHLKEGMPIPDDVNLEDARGLMEDDDDDDEGMMELLMENDYEIGCCVRDQLIPFAVRWYTGEAAPEDHGYDEDEEEDEDEDEDDDDEDDDEDEDERPKKGFKPPARKGKKDGPPGEGKEECKQQ